MSKYTTELRFLVEAGFPLGLDTYPIFQESYRAQLNQKIINHYKFREIGFEVPALFSDRMSEKMNLIMPYYNQLYESLAIKIDPLITHHMTESNDVKKGNTTSSQTSQNTTQDQSATTHTSSDRTEKVIDASIGNRDKTESGENTGHSTDTKNRKETGNNTSDGTASTNSETVGSDTPQGLLTIGNIEGNLYATTATIAKQSNTTKNIDTNTVTGDETDDHTETETQSVTANEKNTLNSTRDITAVENSNGSSDQKLTGNQTGSASTKGDGWQTLMKTLEGFQNINQSEALLKYRETFLNIDMMIINELEPLFMGVY